jgi:hypothetical protein
MILQSNLIIFRNNIIRIFIYSIHPRTKTDVGYRLSRAGLAVAYGQQVEYQGPIVSNVVVNSDSSAIDVTYTSVTGIEFRSPNGFEVYLYIC